MWTGLSAAFSALLHRPCGHGRGSWRRYGRLGLGHRLRRRSGRWLRSFGGVGLGNIDAAFEVSAVFDDDAAGLDIADELGFLLDVDLVGGVHVALNGALDDDFPGLQTGLHAGVRAHGEAVFVVLDRALDFSVDGQIFTRKDLSFYGDVLS